MESSLYDKAISDAKSLWNDIKDRIKNDPEFIKLPDNEKISIYQNSKYKEFYVNNPIVCRYMICMGQFSMNAFKKFLTKSENIAKRSTGSDKSKFSSEERWIMLQADYVRYLWEAYQRQHFSQTDSKCIWQHAYDSLTKEFSDFKKMHADIEEKLKSDKLTGKSELVKEMVRRIANDEQKLDEHSEAQLLNNLKNKLIEQRRRNMINQIKSDVQLVTH